MADASKLPCMLACYGGGSDMITTARITAIHQTRPQGYTISAGTGAGYSTPTSPQQAVRHRTPATPSSPHCPPSQPLDVSKFSRTPITNQSYKEMTRYQSPTKDPPGNITSSLAVETSKLKEPYDPLLTHIDFTAIADTSVGGNGLPRPFGSFQATRHGDGLAVYQRIPQQFASIKYAPFTSTALALPAVPDILPQEEPVQLVAKQGEAPATAKTGNLGAAGWERSRSPSQPSSSRKVLCRPTTRSSCFEHLPATRRSTGEDAESCCSSLDTTLAATFLTEVPSVPGHLRVDCGYSTEKEFMLRPRKSARSLNEAIIREPFRPPVRAPARARQSTFSARSLHGIDLGGPGLKFPAEGSLPRRSIAAGW